MIDLVPQYQTKGNSDIGSSGMSPSASTAAAEPFFAHYAPRLEKMGKQLRQTSTQIEEAVVDVCKSFHGIAERALAGVDRSTEFLAENGKPGSNQRSFGVLIQSCGDMMLKIMSRSTEAGEISDGAIERIHQMDRSSQEISGALLRLENIANGNKILALNARIEAARSGTYGVGFAAVATELTSQTNHSRVVTSEVSDLVSHLRTLAESTLTDLQRMRKEDAKRAKQCRMEVDETLGNLQAAHDQMKEMLNVMTEEGALLANDISAAVRGLQFQDRISQRIAHVVEDLDTLRQRLFSADDPIAGPGLALDEGFSSNSMEEERAIYGVVGTESQAGEVELF